MHAHKNTTLNLTTANVNKIVSKIHVTEVLCDDMFVRKNVDNMLLKKIVSTTTTNTTILKCYFKQIFQLKEAHFYELNLLHSHF